MGRQQIEELSRQEILSATTQREYHQLAQEMLRVTDPTQLREGLDFYPRIQIKAMIEALPALQQHFENTLSSAILAKKMAKPAKRGVALITGKDFDQKEHYLKKIPGFENSDGHCHGLTAMWLVQPKFFPKLRYAIPEGSGNPMIMAMTYLQHHQDAYDPTRNNAFRQAFVDKSYPIKTYRGRDVTKATAVADLLGQAKKSTEIDRAYVHLDLGKNGAHVVGFRFKRGADNQIKEVIYLDTNDKEKRWPIDDGLSESEINKIASEIRMDKFQTMTTVLGDRKTFEEAYCQLMPKVLAQETQRLAQIDSFSQARAVYDIVPLTQQGGTQASSSRENSPRQLIKPMGRVIRAVVGKGKSDAKRVETVNRLFSNNNIAIKPQQTSFAASKTQHELSVTFPNERQLVIKSPPSFKIQSGRRSAYQEIINNYSDLIKGLVANQHIANGEQITIDVKSDRSYSASIELTSGYSIEYSSQSDPVANDLVNINKLITTHGQLIRQQQVNDEKVDQAIALSQDLSSLNLNDNALTSAHDKLLDKNQDLIDATNALTGCLEKVEHGSFEGVEQALAQVTAASQALSQAMAEAQAARVKALKPKVTKRSNFRGASIQPESQSLIKKKHTYTITDKEHSDVARILDSDADALHKYKGKLQGDELKAQLLDDLCEKIDEYLAEKPTCSKRDLKDFVKKQPEVRVIDRAQDAFTRNTRMLGIKTSSRVALNAYVNKAFAADRPAPQQQAKTNFQS